MLHMLTILVSVGTMTLLNSMLVICAAPVAVEENALRNLEMIVGMNLVMMVLRIMMMKYKSTANANVMPKMIICAGLDAMNA